VNARIVLALSASDLERERSNLERGSVMAEGVTGVARGACCDVELVFPDGGRLTVPARAVLTTESATVFAFDGVDREALARHLAVPAAAAPSDQAPIEAPDEAPIEAPGEEAAEGPEAERHAASLHERLRGLTIVEQLKVAREGTSTERVALERIYGKVVWEALLRNPRITIPEVMRLAKMGTMPRPLLELIVGNPAWLQVPQVRRALLSNPRLTTEMVRKVLLLLPRDELQVVPQITAYPPAVRMAAKGMLGR
jgi:hypothetical protein